MVNESHSGKLALLGVRHTYSAGNEKYLVDATKAFDAQVKALPKGVRAAVGLELSPRYLTFLLGLARNPKIVTAAQEAELAKSPLLTFWRKFVAHVDAHHKGIELSALESDSVRKYIFGPGRPARFVELAIHGPGENHAFKIAAKNKINIAVVGTLHIEGYREKFPNSFIAYRVRPNDVERREAQKTRREFREILKKAASARKGVEKKSPGFPYAVTQFTDADLERERKILKGARRTK